MSATFDIRDAVSDDRLVLVGLARQSNAWEARFHPNRDTSEATAEAMVTALWRWLELNDGRWIVAVDRTTDAVIACCAFARVKKAEDVYLAEFDKSYGYIPELTVAEGYRSGGIGTALLAEAENWLATTGVNQIQIGILCDNVGAFRLYERLGFRPYEMTLEKRLDGRTVGQGN